MLKLQATLFLLVCLLSLKKATDVTQGELGNFVDCVFCTNRRQFNTSFSLSSLSPRQSRSLAILALLLSGDVELNPGPRAPAVSVYPCGFCEHAVSWAPETQAVCCDECSIWYHKSCLEMCTKDYSALQNSNVQWICCKCEHINVDSFTYHSFEISPSYYEPLSNISISDSDLSLSPTFNPLYTSSPRSSHGSGQGTPATPSRPTNSNRSTNQTPRSQNSSVFGLPKKTNFRTLTINCQGLNEKKVSSLEADIRYIKPDVVFGTESWLDSSIKSSEVFPADYVAYRKDRVTDTTGGGVFLLVHKSIISTAKPELNSDCEIVWAKIQLYKQKELLVGSFYMPKRKQKDITELDKSLLMARDRHGSKQILLCGDFNCPDVNWDTGTTSPGAQDRQIQQFLYNAVGDAQLTQVHNQPTREGNLLDLVFTSNPSVVKNSKSVPGLADHASVVTDFETCIHYQHQPKRKIHLFAKADWVNLKADLAKAVEEVSALYNAGADTDTLWLTLKNAILKAVDTWVPSRTTTKRRNLPWLTLDIRRLLKRKRRLFVKARKTKNWQNYYFIQKEVRRQLRKAEWNYINDTINKGLQSNNTKPFWRYVKSRKQDNIGVAPLKKNGYLISDTKAKAQILIKQFQSVFTKEERDTPLPPLDEPIHPVVGDITVDTAGVCKLLKDINPAKANGPDLIPNTILKYCAETLAPALRDVFQSSLDTGLVPEEWRKANISCAFKKGDKHLAENYRPISLTSVCCKLLEHIICHHLHRYFEQHRILSELNHGFRAGFSCETQLLTTLHDLLQMFDVGKQVDLTILDFSKAFDTVPHQRLLHKLSHYGVKGTTHRWIENFLTKRTMRVALDGEASEEVPVESGVPQGTVLGPLLFLCFINDLPKAVKSQVRLFADDCLLYRPINSFQDHLILQQDLLSLQQWAQDWGMAFNAKKCHVLSMRQKSSYLYRLNEEILQGVSSNPYLGIILTDDLKWHDHVVYVAKKANCTLGFLRRNLRRCPQHCRKTAYIALVRSVMEYGAIVWDPYHNGDIDRLEQIQRRAARFITQNYQAREEGCVTAMLQDLQLQSLQDRRRQLRLGFFRRVGEGLVPAMPPEHFLTPHKVTKRRIQPRRFEDHTYSNIVERSAVNHKHCYVVPQGKSDQHKNSFFIRTTIEWNNLTEDQVASFSKATNEEK